MVLARKDLKETDKVVPIPVVDIGNLYNLTETEFDLKNPRFLEIAQNIGNSLHQHGFVYLSNHGISEEIVKNSFEESRRFFELPLDVKLKYAKGEENSVVSFHGYAQIGTENLDTVNNDVKEWKEFYDFFTVGRLSYPTPDAPNFAPILQKMEKASRHLQSKLLRLLALAIGLEDLDYFLDRCQNVVSPEKHGSGSIFRTLSYPPIPQNLKSSGTWIGCNEHTDWGVLTLLFQDSIGGLEVKTAEGDWIKATPIPNTIVCNTGGLLEKWTDGYFPATPHRVHVRPITTPTTELSGIFEPESIGKVDPTLVARQSIIFFTQPDDEAMVENLYTDVTRATKKSLDSEPVQAVDYFQNKARLAYRQ